MTTRTQMTPREAILGILGTLPGNKIEGKKRLQKLVQLLQFAGAPIQASFAIHHYGPYSVSLAEATEELCLTGKVKCNEEQYGSYEMWQSVYTLGKTDRKTKPLSGKHQSLLKRLNEYTAVELEVASTIALLRMQGTSEREAIKETKELKPTRAIPRVLKKAEEILTACRAA